MQIVLDVPWHGGPLELDAVWEPNHLAHNRYVAGFLRRARYYRLNRLSYTDMTDLIEECNATWLPAWQIRGAVCGDEPVVPDTGSNWHGLWQYISRKPHSTGIKLYALWQNTYGYVFDVCICTPAAAVTFKEPALAPEILMPKASCAGVRSKCPLRPPEWRTCSSAAMALRNTSPASTGRSGRGETPSKSTRP